MTSISARPRCKHTLLVVLESEWACWVLSEIVRTEAVAAVVIAFAGSSDPGGSHDA
jgi:hypothetical protein